MKTKLLLLLLLANFSIYAQTNLVPNGDFEAWTEFSQPIDWFRISNGLLYQDTDAQKGSSSTKMEINIGKVHNMYSTPFATQSGKTYRITMYHKFVSGSITSIELSLTKTDFFKTPITKKTETSSVNSEWRKIELDYSAADNQNVEISIWVNGTTGTQILVDNVTAIDLTDAAPVYTLIPDVNFENKLIALGIDSGVADGKVLTADIAIVPTLDVSRSSISNLAGIEDFTALTSLTANKNQIVTINLSKNTKLTSLDVSENLLTSLDINANTLLESLNSMKNKLTNLDVSNNTKLTSLVCANNQLTTIDVSSNTLLTGLSINANKITSLNIENNLLLVDLNCSGNQLTSLNVDKNTALKYLWCGANKLTSINIDKNLELDDFRCGNNQLTSLNVKNNKKLLNLNFQINKITSLNISTNTLLDQLICYENELTSLDISHNLDLSLLACQDNKITSIDISKHPKIYEVVCNNNNLTYLNVNNGNNNNFDLFFSNFVGNPDLTCIIVDDVSNANADWADKKDASATFAASCERFTLIPDINFENKLIALGFDSGTPDGKVLTSNIDTVEVLDVNSRNSNDRITDLTGIQDFKSLKSLDFMSNKVTTANLSQNFALTYIDAGFNNLTTLDISNNLELSNLSITGNKLTVLDISQNNNLEYLFCSLNELTNIDVSNNKKLSTLWCKSNLLTSLDVSKNSVLSSLDCSDNKFLTSVNLKNGNNSSLYPHISSINFTSNPALTCIIVDNAIYSNEKWFTFKESTASYSTFDCSQVTAIPDPAFEDKLIALLIDTDGKNGSVLNSSISGVTSLNVSYSSIKDLSGIQGFTNLNSLDCSGNFLIGLDLSSNKALNLVDCHFNPLESLSLKNGNNANFSLNSNFTSNPDLSCIEVDNANYSNNNWTVLKDATAHYSEDCNMYTIIPDPNFEDRLIALEIDKDGKNGKVKTKSVSKVTSLDLGSLNISDLSGIEDFTALTYLDCSYNSISAINTSNNKLLTKLALDYNQLSSLDVTENTELYNLSFSNNQISTFDLSQNKKLHILGANNNLLTSFDFSNNPELESIYCGENNLTTLNVSNLPHLNQLNCIYTNITEIDVTSNPELVWLYVNDNKISHIDLSQNPLLKYLNLGNNQLTTLDLSHNPLLELIFVENNPLTTLNVQNGNNKNFILPSKTGKNAAGPIDVTSFLKTAKLSCIQVDDVNYSNANWSHIKESTASYSSKCTLGTNNDVFNKVAMYPNPTKGEVYISNVSLDKATVYNSLGQLVKSFILDASNTDNTINLSGLPRGIYYVYLINGDAASAKKIIVE
ncbi:T9SS type A sorting domain-containing protein [Flavobacterium sp. ACN6]|uniref:T9SS type A sorting domain-containing protein n=1 Tax=Flavobacterium sp. ACN6 TaxID=1920426 RepID=UPI000BB3C99C|nr:T9SS type A sorting domain-containing protein [Flavobacterium sp. ACN6]PBJ11436.1 Internalin-J precursor [Flavobacterium sp. ACN6]